MVVTFNFQYYHDAYHSDIINLTFDTPVHRFIAKRCEAVGEVIDQAEYYQKEGYYVALYLPYEAVKYYNDSFKLKDSENGIYAACYVFEHPVTEHNNEKKTVVNQPLAFRFTESKTQIQHQIERIQQEIIEGQTYQVNYTTRLEAPITMGIQSLYQQLTAQTNGHYTALFDTDEIQVASISPELFFQMGPFDEHEKMVVSKPMKGTMPRGNTKTIDDEHKQALETSEKDRAENVMIVDLLRNDITRIAQPGTIRTPRLFDVERYPTVFQMTSMVIGEVADNKSLNDVMRALFPCGSITGAPKVNTMRIIHELEASPRHIYCGTLGLCLPDGRAIFNVPIRTVQYLNEKAIYGVGAGITIDSDSVKEYAEFQDKTKILEG
ncbi:anthranilate synthase component I family protein [Staphylococcus chromogenes]|uniref:anthranilate synthase component I family protein n=1 Tax=Staphylococcus chromogenes TaxID=46126 RepID=UPI000D1A51F1|nr:anthranilate synthase component I family protein [Staphylococcus chromogenes]PTF73505.1 aminodeoxychorismate synthase component I [Staphylococcus chromogenes]PTG82049.1 aminodeoxychorismate synthase component I [Staphylococcus chromogenes]